MSGAAMGRIFPDTEETKPADDQKPTSIRLTPAMKKRLDKVAARLGWPRTKVILHLLKVGLDEDDAERPKK